MGRDCIILQEKGFTKQEAQKSVMDLWGRASVGSHVIQGEVVRSKVGRASERGIAYHA